MTTVGSYQAKTRLPELIQRVARGEKILITRRGVPVALLTQPPGMARTDVKQAVESMLAFRDQFGPRLGKLTVRELVDEGRRY
jgi:antitoxin (DNA-binding transcriptional repressor) of toxin-antitoxin stability system